jgi:hypothetical protein
MMDFVGPSSARRQCVAFTVRNKRRCGVDVVSDTSQGFKRQEVPPLTAYLHACIHLFASAKKW